MADTAPPLVPAGTALAPPPGAGDDRVRRFDEQMERMRVEDPQGWADYWAEAAVFFSVDDID